MQTDRGKMLPQFDIPAKRGVSLFLSRRKMKQRDDGDTEQIKSQGCGTRSPTEWAMLCWPILSTSRLTYPFSVRVNMNTSLVRNKLASLEATLVRNYDLIT